MIDTDLRDEIMRFGREVAPDGDFQQLIIKLALRCHDDIEFSVRVCASAAWDAIETARAEARHDRKPIQLPDRSVINGPPDAV
jgi:hypothetical protein